METCRAEEIVADRLLERISCGDKLYMPHFAVGRAIYLMRNWGKIPAQVPVHYNASGTIDRWGNKRELLVIMALGWVIYAGMATIFQFPSAWNTSVHITAKSKERVYGILKNILDTLQLLIAAVFSFFVVNSSLSNALSI